MSRGREGSLESEDDQAGKHDPPIKLFGRDIPVASSPLVVATACSDAMQADQMSDQACVPPCVQDTLLQVSTCKEVSTAMVSDELGSSSGSNDVCDDEKPACIIIGSQSPQKVMLGSEAKTLKVKDNEAHEMHDKMPRKPDKLLPCPRCNSLETKFCYFNNYNINQPRHFCKKCQRYWTAGGTLRNVPVGAGRRKNKHSVAHQKHVMSDIVTVRADARDLAHQANSSVTTASGTPSSQTKAMPVQSRLQLHPLEACPLAALDSPTSGTVLSFGQENPLCESMAATSLTGQMNTHLQNSGNNNGWPVHLTNSNLGADGDHKFAVDHKPGVQSTMLNFGAQSYQTSQPADSHSDKVGAVASSAVTTPGGTVQVSAADVKTEPMNHGGTVKSEGFTVSYGVGPWQYGFNLSWNNTAAAAPIHKAENVSSAAVPTLLTPNPLSWNGAPRGVWTGLPWPLLQSAMWGPQWPGPWGVPWGPAATAAAAAAAAVAVASNPGLTSTNSGSASANPVLVSPAPVSVSSTPGSVTTNSNASSVRKHRLESLQSDSGTEVLVPKTLRIDDPVEAARSSIWKTLGLKEGPGPSSLGGVTKVFHPKNEIKDSDESTVQTSHSNPAALSRSMTFQENG